MTTMHISAQLQPLWRNKKSSESCHSLKDQLAWLHDADDNFKLKATNQDKLDDKHQPLNTWLSANLTQAIELFSKKTEVNHNVAASMWLKSFNNQFFTSLVALRLKFNRVPVIQFNDIFISTPNGEKIKSLQINNNCHFVCLESDPLASSSQSTVVASHEQLDDAFTHLIQQIGGGLSVLFEKERLKHRPFWGSISLAVSVFFMRLTEKGLSAVLAKQILPNAQQWLSNIMPDIGKDLAHIHVAEKKERAILYVQRETCCLKYKIDGKKKCATCHLLSDEERIKKNSKRIPS
ncbi:(2Fe-2S)-binding protein [Aliivibrio fischeri]|uniref:(2Fe-2S)-binding protein n=1 Tax=Aliivibrio fischeri TaxID=668 RepID=UPI0009C132DF|nr:(2Fe-2S)-binding protein [Aliivibrio fischeri]